MIKIYKNAEINGKLTDITTENGKIVSLEKTGESGFDLKGLKVYPGLVDIHTHGCIGYDTMDGDKLKEMSEYYLKNGVTSWLPTTMTVSVDKIKSVTNSKIPENCGSEILGFHLEGPYISPGRKGAQNEKYIKSPDLDEFNGFDNVLVVTIAPELENSDKFIKNCKAIVSIGHTDADYSQCVKAIENGAKSLTHTFNAMPSFHHRNSGPIGAAIDKNIYVEVICDGLHLSKSIITMLYRTFGKDKVILISDSMRATGLCDGEYEFGGQLISVKNGVALTTEGAIAGSTHNLFQCVKQAIEFGIPEQDAFYMASTVPCEFLGINKGKLENGFDSDFIVLDDELNLHYAVVGENLYDLTK